MSVIRSTDRPRSPGARIPELRAAPRLSLEQRQLLGELQSVIDEIKAARIHIVRIRLERTGPGESSVLSHSRIDIELADGAPP